MPTIITHAVVGAALAQTGLRSVPRGRLAIALAALSVFPDLDVIAFRLGIPYSHWLGHRGLFHSLLFAIFVAALIARFSFRQVRLCSRDWWYLFGLCALAMVSHGVLDAFTDGGLGIAFFLPFSDSRYFFPFHPIMVSPIGVQNFLRGPAIAVLVSEVIYVWVPLATVLALAQILLRRSRSAA